MKSVIIHIGMGRCGSSALQKALRDNFTNLQKSGIYYPETTLGDNANHVLGMLKTDKIETSVQKWKDVIEEFESSRCETLLVSSENFVAISNTLFEAKREILSGYLVKIIFLFRSQWELLPSVYAQWTKAGILFRSFSHFYTATKKEWNFDYILKRWSDAYGKQNIHCGLLQEKMNVGRVFAKCIDEKITNWTQGEEDLPRINKSINWDLIAILKIFDLCNSKNIIMGDFPGWNYIEPSRPDRNEAIRQRIIKALEKASQIIPQRKNNTINTNRKKEISNYYLKSNIVFHEKYLKEFSEKWYMFK
jgi:hypothetical protein